MYSKILIIGANGQLAFDLIRALENEYTILKATHSDFDICDYVATERFIKKNKPHVVINTAAFHNTTACELDPSKSFQVNAVGAYNVAKAAALVNASVVFLSSDYIFDGSKKKFSEEDKPNPLNVYGASKLAGEVLLKIANPKYYIVRTTGMFGFKSSGKGHNFVTLMLEKAKLGEHIRVVNDQYVSPTYSFDLAGKIKELVDKKAPYGIYHITNLGFCSWYEFAKKIFELAQVNARISPIKSQASGSIVKRPQYSVLASKNLRRAGIKILRPWQEALGAYLDELGQI